MNAKKCDRCGKFYDIEGVNVGVRVFTYHTGYSETEIDLCIDCQNAFVKEFLKGENKGER